MEPTFDHQRPPPLTYFVIKLLHSTLETIFDDDDKTASLVDIGGSGYSLNTFRHLYHYELLSEDSQSSIFLEKISSGAKLMLLAAVLAITMLIYVLVYRELSRFVSFFLKFRQVFALLTI
jgi:hypothetical protein